MLCLRCFSLLATRSRNAKVRARRIALESLETRQLMATLPVALQPVEVHMVFGQTLSQVLPGATFPVISQGYPQTQTDGVNVDTGGNTYLHATNNSLAPGTPGTLTTPGGPDVLNAVVDADGDYETVTAYVSQANWAISADSGITGTYGTATVLSSTLTSLTGPSISGDAGSVLPVEFSVTKTADQYGNAIAPANQTTIQPTFNGLTPVLDQAGTFSITPAVDPNQAWADHASVANDVNFTFSPNTVVVSPLTLTVHANANTKTVGETAHDSGTVTGALSGDVNNIEASFTSDGDIATAPVSGSPYAINANLSGSALNNYVVTYDANQGSLTVDPAPVFGSITGGTKTFDGTDTANVQTLLTTQYLFSYSDGTDVATGQLNVNSNGVATSGSLTLTACADPGVVLDTYYLVGGNDSGLQQLSPTQAFFYDNSVAGGDLTNNGGLLFSSTGTQDGTGGTSAGTEINIWDNNPTGTQWGGLNTWGFAIGADHGGYPIATQNGSSCEILGSGLANVNMGQATLAGITLTGNAVFDAKPADGMAASDAGEHTVTLNNAALAGTDSNDYVLTNASSITENAQINAIVIPPTVTNAAALSHPYGGPTDVISAQATMQGVLVPANGSTPAYYDTSWQDVTDPHGIAYTFDYKNTTTGADLRANVPFNAGSYSVTVTYTGSNNYAGPHYVGSDLVDLVPDTSAPVDFTIGQITGNVVVSATPTTYGVAPDYSATFTPTIAGSYTGGLEFSFIITGNKSTSQNYTANMTPGGVTIAGNDHSVVATPFDPNNNYVISGSLTAPLTVTQAGVLAAYDVNDKTFDNTNVATLKTSDTDFPNEQGYVVGAKVGDDTLTLVNPSGGAFAPVFSSANAGTYNLGSKAPNVSMAAILGGADASNYYLILPAGLANPATISAATVTPVVNVSDMVYDGAADPVTATMTGVNGDTSLNGASTTLSYFPVTGYATDGSPILGTQLANPPVNAGSYAVTASFAATGNYTASSSTRYFAIEQVTGNIVIHTQNISYGQAPDLSSTAGTVTPTIPGAYMGGLGVSFSVSDATVNSDYFYDAGTHTITATLTDPGGNYNITGSLNAPLNVAQDTVTVTALQGGGYSVSGFVSPDNSALTTDGKNLAADIAISSATEGNGTVTLTPYLINPISLKNYTFKPVSVNYTPVTNDVSGIGGGLGVGYSDATSYSGNTDGQLTGSYSAVPTLDDIVTGFVLDKKTGKYVLKTGVSI